MGKLGLHGRKRLTITGEPRHDTTHHTTTKSCGELPKGGRLMVAYVPHGPKGSRGTGQGWVSINFIKLSPASELTMVVRHFWTGRQAVAA